jgi:hypothetical protein
MSIWDKISSLWGTKPEAEKQPSEMGIADIKELQGLLSAFIQEANSSLTEVRTILGKLRIEKKDWKPLSEKASLFIASYSKLRAKHNEFKSLKDTDPEKQEYLKVIGRMSMVDLQKSLNLLLNEGLDSLDQAKKDQIISQITKVQKVTSKYSAVA